MNSKLLLDLSKSLLLARWKQTLIAAFGVTFGIAMFITLLGFMTGLNKLLDGLLLNRAPHVRLYQEIEPEAIQPIHLYPPLNKSYHFVRSVKSGNGREELHNSVLIMEALQKDERVLGYAPRIVTQVFFNNGTSDLPGVIFGVDPEKESKLFFFNDYITPGSASQLKNVSSGVILGKGLAKKLSAEIGETVYLTTSRGESFNLKVLGFFQSGITEIDKTQCYATTSTAQKILGRDANYITDINIKLKDVAKAPSLSKEFGLTFETDAEDIQTANSQFDTGSKIRTIISFAVGITLLIVAGFGIYNILNMMIYEKMDSIAILKATGFSGNDVKMIFLLIAMSIGVFGGVVGLTLGLILSSIIDNIPFNTAALPTITTYPINYDLRFYAIGLLFSLITTYFAGLFPAKKAGKIDPVIIIRGK